MGRETMIKNIQLESLSHRLINHWAMQYIILGIITIIAAALRLYKLGEWSFWWDELFTVRDAINYIDYDIIDRSLFRTLNYLVLSHWEINEWNVRIVSAIIGILSIPILYFPIRRIFNMDIALLSMLLLAISPWHIYWSQSARFYTTLLLLYTLALLIFFIAIEEDKPFYLVISMLFMGLAIIERFSSAIIVVVMGSYLTCCSSVQKIQRLQY
jgi:mannosyltransferase